MSMMIKLKMTKVQYLYSTVCTYRTVTLKQNMYSTYVQYGTVSCNGVAIIEELVVLWGISFVEADKEFFFFSYSTPR